MTPAFKKTPAPWLAHRRGTDIQTLCTRILTADVCLSDLDDTDADSPGKRIALHGIGSGFDPIGYAKWCVETAVKSARHGKNAESEQWKKYVEQFLRYPGSKAAVEALFTPELVVASLYPGVQELYALLPAQKFYITRNIAEVANAYGTVLKFQGTLIEIDKRSKKSNVVLQGLKCPHFIRTTREGYLVSDTLNNRVFILDRSLRRKKIFKGDYNWLQDTIELSDGSFLLGDSNNARIVHLDSRGRKLDIFQMPQNSRKIFSFLKVSKREALQIFGIKAILKN